MIGAAAPLAAWPRRFVYICKATRAAIVNAAPVIHAGPNRVAGLVILCGIKDRDQPLLEEDDLKKGAYQRAAQEAGVRILHGPAAAETLMTEIAALP